eukprot:CAMPEP_0198227210 /NCGR_PEP_ID=MMETSP1445-20131203/108383_1 /TAXON_ID=36898 /ORGANISM="Pyramimonas sp., Strain CCMP2087" /LENGTH=163 /DNA_ID=CAMNT_0043907209 /DNA_START=276 /DNA_END=764 /DNA_ORIENTATION=-
MEAYKRFVKQNAPWLSTAEGLAQALTWLLPNRSDELTLEAASAALGLFSVFNEHLLAEMSEKDNHNPASGPKKPRLPWPVWIALLQQVEICSEMAADRVLGKEGPKKYRILAAVEGFKYFLRLLLLKQSGERMLLEAGAVQPNSWDAQKLSSSPSSSLSKVIT